MDVSKLYDPQQIEQWVQAARDWATANLLSVDNLVQLGVILATFIAARLLSPRLEGLLDKRPDSRWYVRFGVPVVAALKPVARPLVWLTALWFSVFAAKGAVWPHHLMEGAVSLLTAWAVIRLASGPDPQFLLVARRRGHRLVPGGIEPDGAARSGHADPGPHGDQPDRSVVAVVVGRAVPGYAGRQPASVYKIAFAGGDGGDGATERQVRRVETGRAQVGAATANVVWPTLTVSALA